MEREYTVSKGMKIFYILLAVGMLIFAIVLFKLPQSNPALFLLPLSIVTGAILIVINILKRKVIIYDDSILCISLFSRKEITFKDIKGCRIGQKVLVIESISADKAKLTIGNYSDLNDSDELRNWVKENFKNLDAADLENERNKALQDSYLGASESERESTIEKYKYISWAYNIIGIIVGFAITFVNGKAGVIFLLLYPLFGIALMIFSKGLIKFLSNSKRSVYGFTMPGIFIPGFVLMIKSLFDYTLITYENLWLPFLLISAMFFIIIYRTGINKAVEFVKSQAVIMLIAAFIYGFGSTREMNCAFDESSPKSINTTVDSKWIENSKGEHYHLKIKSWDSDLKPKNIEVSRSTYNRFEYGESIDVFLKAGLLHIPWFYINE